MLSEQNIKSSAKKASFHNIWQILGPYWWSEERLMALGLLALIVGLNMGLVYLTVLFNEWNRFFYDSLQNKNFDEFTKQLIRFSLMALAYIAIAVYRIYLNQMLEMRWRRWLTDRYIGWWMRDRVYYRMSLYGDGADNPDQRIAEDLRLFTSGALSLSLGLLSAVVSIISFVGILWSLSGSFEFMLAGQQISVPGYLVWVALLYALCGSFIAHLIGRPLIRLNFQQQRFEADFRFDLVRVRENAEGIALYGGEGLEHQHLNTGFASILQNWWRIMVTQKQLGWFTSSYNQVAIIFPFVVTAPRFFKGAIQLGGMMQIVSAFANVQSNLSWFIDNYRVFADWKASANRLTTFHEAIERAKYEGERETELRLEETKDAVLAIEDLCLKVPGERLLQRNIQTRISSGEKVLVKGPSGAGKSTLFRTIAGIWPFASGSLKVPRQEKRLFLPQKPYIPIGTLREAVSYPSAAGAFLDSEIENALELCCLPELKTRLDETAHWEHVLSPGEQQRISFARVLLHKPDWVFLDEATSSVDDAAQEKLYRVLIEKLPAAALLSIAHRPGVERFHERVLELGEDLSRKP